MGTNGHERRPIGILERFHATRNFLGFDTCVVASARYTAHHRQHLTESVLFPALRQVVLAHPSLCFKLENETSPHAGFARLRTINLSEVVQFSMNEGHLHTSLSEQLARGFDAATDLPLWRVQVLSDNTVIFAVHHIIGDGLSSTSFHMALLQALQHPANTDASPVIPISTTTIMTPPVEELVDIRPSLWTLASSTYKYLAPKAFLPGSSAWTGRKVPRSAAGVTLRPHVHLFALPPTEIASLRNTCRKHSATLTSAFYSIATSTLARMLDEAVSSTDKNSARPRRRYRSISAGVAISLRDCTQVMGALPRTAICDAVSAHYTYPPLDPNFSWTAAARYADVLRVQKLNKARETVGMLRFLGNDYTAYMRGHLGAKREYGFVISNLGPMPTIQLEGDPAWTMENVVFAQCDIIVGAAFKINVVGDLDGGANFAVTWGDESIEQEFVDEFVMKFRDMLRTLVD